MQIIQFEIAEFKIQLQNILNKMNVTNKKFGFSINIKKIKNHGYLKKTQKQMKIEYAKTIS